jgi:hypothetical protein
MISPDFDYEPTFRVGKHLFISEFKKTIEGCNDVIAFIKEF